MSLSRRENQSAGPLKRREERWEGREASKSRQLHVSLAPFQLVGNEEVVARAARVRLPLDLKDQERSQLRAPSKHQSPSPVHLALRELV